MKSLLDQLSNAQLLYIVERLRMEYLTSMQLDVPSIKSKPSEVNFEYVKELLSALATTDPQYQESIRFFIEESNDPRKLNQVVAMGIGQKVRLTSIILISKLISPLEKARIVLEKGLDPDERSIAMPIRKTTSTDYDEQEEKIRDKWYESERKFTAQNTQQEPIDVVILTPRPVEFEAVTKLLDRQIDIFSRDSTFYRFGYINDLRIIVRESGAGNIVTALAAEKAISIFQPKIILLVGMAGGISSKVSLGDIVIAERSCAYEAGKATEESLMTRQKGGTYDSELCELAKMLVHRSPAKWLQHTTTSGDYKMFMGTIAAGEKVIATSKTEIFQQLKQSCQDALAVEMEAVGLTTALEAYRGKVKGLNIRSISDLLDDKEQLNAGGSRELASEHAAAFAFEFLGLSELRRYI